MKNIIVGTAGHIDHGKTSLVRALTGIDTDRLKEEKERGISIELGFANLTTPAGLRIAFVDVPGHERFVKNMLAGVSGIDVVLFVIAADEAIKPQTREHFEICRLLGLERGVIALTKADLVEADWLELVQLEVEDFVRGSFLEGAPMIPVSSVTGFGLDPLQEALIESAAGQTLRNSTRLPRLPLDRAFVMKGHGTVVTGTLKEGRLATESEVELYPSGRVARIRSIQVHGKSVKEALAGQRTAVNLAGVEVQDMERGFVAAPPGLLRSVRMLDAEVELLPQARALRDRAKVHFHTGTAEVTAELRTLTGGRQIEPGTRTWVRLALARETLVLPEDRFILRSFSPVTTIGGGTVMEIHPAARRLRRKGVAERLEHWKSLDSSGRISLLVTEQPTGVDFATVQGRLGCDTTAIPKDIERAGNWLVATVNLKQLAGKLVDFLREHHRTRPLEPGLARESLRSTLLRDAPAPVMDLLLRHAPSVKTEAEFLRLESHKVRFAGAEDAAAQAIEKAFADAAWAVPAVDEVLKSTQLDASKAKAVLAVLLRDKKLVRVGPDLIFHAEALQSLKELLNTRKGMRFSVADFKDWTGVSRKYAIPLLEFLDREKITRRDGEARVVL